jgi:hypothetical protein
MVVKFTTSVILMTRINIHTIYHVEKKCGNGISLCVEVLITMYHMKTEICPAIDSL